MTDRAHLQRLMQNLTDDGKLIEAGWVSLRLAAIADDAPKVQLEEMRQAFFAGAQHLFSSIMSIMDRGEEPTDKDFAQDLARLDMINVELDGFIKDFERRRLRPKPAVPPPSTPESPHTLGDAPIEEKYREKMNALAHMLDDFFNGKAMGDERQTGFVLLVFPFGAHEGRSNYISNAAREDIVVLMKEQIAQFEGQPEVKGHA
jgi:hypothetical protein